MAVSAIYTIVSYAVAAYGAYNTYASGQKAKKAGEKQEVALQSSAAEQRKQFAAQQRIADIKNARERANTARQVRMARGAIQSQGANTGTSGSSGVIGGIASTETQGASNLGTFGSIQGNQEDINASQSAQSSFAADAGRAQGDSIQAQADISSSQGIFNIGQSLFKEGGGFKTIFDAVTV